MFEQKIEIEMP